MDGMNETLDWSWRGMNGNFNFGDCCDGYGGLLHAPDVLLQLYRDRKQFFCFVLFFIQFTTFKLRFSSCCFYQLLQIIRMHSDLFQQN